MRVNAKTSVATMTKGTAAVAPERTRKVMPPATVINHRQKPCGQTRSGCRHVRQISQPTPKAARKGQAVSSTPPTESPSRWELRPARAKSSTTTMSAVMV